MADGQTPGGRKLVEISGPLFFGFMMQGRVWGEDRILRITRGLPEDAEMVALHYDPDRDRWLMTVASTEWPPSKPGEPLEHCLIHYQTEERWRSTATPPEVPAGADAFPVLMAWGDGRQSSGVFYRPVEAAPFYGGAWCPDREACQGGVHDPLWWQPLPPSPAAATSTGDSDV